MDVRILKIVELVFFRLSGVFLCVVCRTNRADGDKQNTMAERHKKSDKCDGIVLLRQSWGSFFKSKHPIICVHVFVTFSPDQLFRATRVFVTFLHCWIKLSQVRREKFTLPKIHQGSAGLAYWFKWLIIQQVGETGKKVLFSSDTSTIPWRIASSSVEEELRSLWDGIWRSGDEVGSVWSWIDQGWELIDTWADFEF